MILAWYTINVSACLHKEFTGSSPGKFRFNVKYDIRQKSKSNSGTSDTGTYVKSWVAVLTEQQNVASRIGLNSGLVVGKLSQGGGYYHIEVSLGSGEKICETRRAEEGETIFVKVNGPCVKPEIGSLETLGSSPRPPIVYVYYI